MRLALYRSAPGKNLPNLIALQDENLAALPTVLVCPLKAGLTLTDLRVQIVLGDRGLVACPELARPIRRTALRFVGLLDSEHSAEVMARFQLILAR